MSHHSSAHSSDSEEDVPPVDGHIADGDMDSNHSLLDALDDDHPDAGPLNDARHDRPNSPPPGFGMPHVGNGHPVMPPPLNGQADLNQVIIMMQLQMQQQADESRRREQALERRREDDLRRRDDEIRRERDEARREREEDNRRRDEQFAALLAQQNAGVAQTTTALTESLARTENEKFPPPNHLLPYSGNDKKVSFAVWIPDFEQFVQTYPVSSKIRCLLTLLTGQARLYADSLSHEVRQDYVAFIAALKDKYTDKRSAKVRFAEFLTDGFTGRPEEDVVTQFVSNKIHEIFGAGPVDVDTLIMATVNCFCRRDPTWAKKVTSDMADLTMNELCAKLKSLRLEFVAESKDKGHVPDAKDKAATPQASGSGQGGSLNTNQRQDHRWSKNQPWQNGQKAHIPGKPSYGFNNQRMPLFPRQSQQEKRVGPVPQPPANAQHHRQLLAQGDTQAPDGQPSVQGLEFQQEHADPVPGNHPIQVLFDEGSIAPFAQQHSASVGVGQVRLLESGTPSARAAHSGAPKVVNGFGDEKSPITQPRLYSILGPMNNIFVDGVSCTNIVLDTGCHLTCVSVHLAHNMLQIYERDGHKPEDYFHPDYKTALTGFDGSICRAVGSVRLPIRYSSPSGTWINTVIWAAVIPESHYDVLLGMDWMVRVGFRLVDPYGYALTPTTHQFPPLRRDLSVPTKVQLDQSLLKVLQCPAAVNETDPDETQQVVSVSHVTVGMTHEDKAKLDLVNDLKLKLVWDDVPSSARKPMEKVLGHYKETVFSHSDTDIGFTGDLVEHKIELVPGGVPIKQRVRYTTHAQEAVVASHVESMLANNIITPVSSEWASPVVLVGKKDGSIRFCIDFRMVNRVTKFDSFPLPNIDETLAKFAGAQYFSSLDLTSGYWQIPVAKDSKEITTFTCHLGTFQWERMPFGLLNAGQTLQRFIEKAMAPMLGRCCFVYVDDMIVYSKTPEQHVKDLRQVFDALVKSGFKLKPRKCELFKREVTYLGHTVSADGIKIDASKIDKVTNFPIPTTVKQLQSALGLFNYFRHFVPQFSLVARPLTALLNKDIAFKWNAQADEAFTKLKTLITSRPILGHPNFDEPFVIFVDASALGFGAVLMQKNTDDQKLHPIDYASRKTTVHQSKLASVRLEAMAVLWAVRKFRFYIDQMDTIVYTDCVALIPMFECPQKHHAIFKECVLLQDFRLKLRHKPGVENSCADALSRIPNPDVSLVTAPVRMSALALHTEQVEGDVAVQVDLPAAYISTFKECNLIEGQKKDLETRVWRDFLESARLPEDPVMRRTVTLQQGHFTLVRNVLCRRTPKSGNIPYIPLPMRGHIVANAHEGIHGIHAAGRAMYLFIRSYAWWPGMAEDCHAYADACLVCGQFNNGRRPVTPLSQKAFTRPFENVEIDVADVGPSKSGFRWLICFIDTFTRWVEAIPLKRPPTAKEVARHLKEVIIARHGVPKSIQTDRGLCFENRLMADITQALGIEQHTSFSYTPRSQGHVERLNQTLKRALAKRLCTHPNAAWEELLPAVLLGYRTAVHRSTGYSPFYLLYGRICNLPLGMPPVPTVQDDTPKGIDKAVDETIAKMEGVWREAAERSSRTQRVEERYFARKRVKNLPYIRPNDLVFLFHPQHKTLDPQYSGPYRVVQLTSTGATIRLHHPKCENAFCEACDVLYLVSLERLKLMKPTKVSIKQQKEDDRQAQRERKSLDAQAGTALASSILDTQRNVNLHAHAWNAQGPPAAGKVRHHINLHTEVQSGRYKEGGVGHFIHLNTPFIFNANASYPIMAGDESNNSEDFARLLQEELDQEATLADGGPAPVNTIVSTDGGQGAGSRRDDPAPMEQDSPSRSCAPNPPSTGHLAVRRGGAGRQRPERASIRGDYGNHQRRRGGWRRPTEHKTAAGQRRCMKNRDDEGPPNKRRAPPSSQHGLANAERDLSLHILGRLVGVAEGPKGGVKEGTMNKRTSNRNGVHRGGRRHEHDRGRRANGGRGKRYYKSRNGGCNREHFGRNNRDDHRRDDSPGPSHVV